MSSSVSEHGVEQRAITDLSPAPVLLRMVQDRWFGFLNVFACSVINVLEQAKICLSENFHVPQMNHQPKHIE